MPSDERQDLTIIARQDDSITLAAATLGLVNVPGPPVEAAIALSIVLVAVEIVNSRRGTSSLAARWPIIWLC